MSLLVGTGLLAVVTALACALPGVFVVLQRRSMLIDGIGHAILPGIVIGIGLTGTFDSPWLIVGAALMGLVVVVGAEALERSGLVAGDSSQGLLFPALFSIGVILLSTRFRSIGISEHSVLVGDLNLAAFLPLTVAGIDIGPRYLYVMLIVLAVNVAFLLPLCNSLKLLTFDPLLAATQGLPVRVLRYSFMFLVSVTTTAAFHAAGTVLVIALFVVPAAAGWLLSTTLRGLFLRTSLFAVGGATAGFLLAYELDVATSAGMALFYGLAFLVVYVAVRLRRGARSPGRRGINKFATGQPSVQCE